MDCLELLPGFNAVGLCLHMPGEGLLAFGDTHLGYEEELNKKGVMIPHFQYQDVVRHLGEVLDSTRPETVVVNGDLKHEFGRISSQEWREVLRFLDFLGDYEVKLVKGNHDTILGPIAEKKNVEVVEELRAGNTLFIHGHAIPEDIEGIQAIVMGHEHPCIGLREDERVEKVKCFLTGKWEGRSLIVLPSLNYVTEGVDILQESLLSPLLQGDIGDFRAYGAENGEILEFGELRFLL
ncbi:MAG: phosphoesterase [Candidatus Altiarchaeales archaeon]|nr:phosphoesterase [Candidatus Altiarchaeales archaeon]MBD3417297.1 phosphoesterase [Candidatus Altiarchaeales archaeon]